MLLGGEPRQRLGREAIRLLPLLALEGQLGTQQIQLQTHAFLDPHRQAGHPLLRLGQGPREVLHVIVIDGTAGTHHQQDGIVLQHSSGQALQLIAHQQVIALLHQRRPVLGQDLAQTQLGIGLFGMTQGIHHLMTTQQRLAGTAMHPAQQLGIPRQTLAQKVTEYRAETVAALLAAIAPDPFDKQTVALQEGDLLEGMLPLGDLAGQRLVKPLQHTDHQHEGLNGSGQLTEYLLAQVIMKRLMGFAALLPVQGKAATFPLQQAEELEPSRPAIELAPHRFALLGRQGQLELVAKKLLTLP